jgi:hypothetical protein
MPADATGSRLKMCAVSAGGIKPNVSSFGADQFNEACPQVRACMPSVHGNGSSICSAIVMQCSAMRPVLLCTGALWGDRVLRSHHMPLHGGAQLPVLPAALALRLQRPWRETLNPVQSSTSLSVA